MLKPTRSPQTICSRVIESPRSCVESSPCRMSLTSFGCHIPRRDQSQASCDLDSLLTRLVRGLTSTVFTSKDQAACIFQQLEEILRSSIMRRRTIVPDPSNIGWRQPVSVTVHLGNCESAMALRCENGCFGAVSRNHSFSTV